jgi:hypothetical protein
MSDFDFEIEGDDMSGSGFLESSWSAPAKPKNIAPKSTVGGKLGSSLFGGAAAAAPATGGGSKFGAAAAGGGDEYDFEVRDYTDKVGRKQRSPVDKKKGAKPVKATKPAPLSKDMSALERAEAMMNRYKGGDADNTGAVRHKSRLPESYEDDFSLGGSSDGSPEADFSVSDSQSLGDYKVTKGKASAPAPKFDANQYKVGATTKQSVGATTALKFNTGKPSPPKGVPPAGNRAKPTVGMDESDEDDDDVSESESESASEGPSMSLSRSVGGGKLDAMKNVFDVSMGQDDESESSSEGDNNANLLGSLASSASSTPALAKYKKAFSPEDKARAKAGAKRAGSDDGEGSDFLVDEEEDLADYYAVDSSALKSKGKGKSSDSNGGNDSDTSEVEHESPSLKVMSFADLGAVTGWTEEDEAARLVNERPVPIKEEGDEGSDFLVDSEDNNSRGRRSGKGKAAGAAGAATTAAVAAVPKAISPVVPVAQQGQQMPPHMQEAAGQQQQGMEGSSPFPYAPYGYPPMGYGYPPYYPPPPGTGDMNATPGWGVPPPGGGMAMPPPPPGWPYTHHSQHQQQVPPAAQMPMQTAQADAESALAAALREGLQLGREIMGRSTLGARNSSLMHNMGINSGSGEADNGVYGMSNKGSALFGGSNVSDGQLQGVLLDLLLELKSAREEAKWAKTKLQDVLDGKENIQQQGGSGGGGGKANARQQRRRSTAYEVDEELEESAQPPAFSGGRQRSSSVTSVKYADDFENSDDDGEEYSQDFERDGNASVASRSLRQRERAARDFLDESGLSVSMSQSFSRSRSMSPSQKGPLEHAASPAPVVAASPEKAPTPTPALAPGTAATAATAAVAAAPAAVAADSSAVYTMSQAHTAELSSAMGTSQSLFRRQLEGLRERLHASNGRAESALPSGQATAAPARPAAAAGGGGSTSAPSLQEIKATFEQRRTDSAHQMKQLLASIDPSLALFN